MKAALKNKSAIVYCAINCLNGKKYVGITSATLKKRINGHKSRSKEREGNGHFQHAIRKHGFESFNWYTLSKWDNYADALKEEVRVIALVNPEYNSTLGGEGVAGLEAWNRKPVICLEDNKVFHSFSSAAEHYGSNGTDIADACNGVSSIAVGKHFRNYFFPLSDDERKNLIEEIDSSFANKRKWKNRNPKWVENQLFLRKMTKSIKKEFNSLYSEIVNWKNHKVGRSNKATWKKYSVLGPAKVAKKIICLTDGMVFDSISSAAKYYESSHSAISELCNGKKCRKKVNGRAFKFLEIV